MDESNSCYMFEVPSDAIAFVSPRKGVKLDTPKHYTQKNACSLFYSYGIDFIKIKQRGKDDYIVIPINENEVEKRFYAHSANQYLTNLELSNKKKYLSKLMDKPLISPIVTSERKVKKYPRLHYCHANFNDDSNNYYLLFSTMEEFDKWNADQERNWMPLEIPLNKFKRIRKNNPIIINPLSDKLLLSDKQLNSVKVTKEKKK